MGVSHRTRQAQAQSVSNPSEDSPKEDIDEDLIVSRKRPWTDEEDTRLRALVNQHGARKWSLIAYLFGGRTGRQCRERWFNHLNPNVVKGGWTPEEDKVIVEYVKKYGNKWSMISKVLSGRTDNSIKNHYNSTIKKRLKKSKSRARHDSSEEEEFSGEDYSDISEREDDKVDVRYESKGEDDENTTTVKVTPEMEDHRKSRPKCPEVEAEAQRKTSKRQRSPQRSPPPSPAQSFKGDDDENFPPFDLDESLQQPLSRSSHFSHSPVKCSTTKIRIVDLLN